MGTVAADHAQPQSDDGIGSRVRRAAAYCLAPARLRRTAIITIVVGTILTLLNQGDVIVSGAATTATLVKTGLNYAVPFVVSNLGMLSGRDTAHDGRADVIEITVPSAATPYGRANDHLHADPGTMSPMTTETRGRVRSEPGAKRVRAFFAGVPVFDTTHPLLVWEGPHLPVYYVPVADVDTSLLIPSDGTERSPSRGTAELWSIKVGDHVAEHAARQYPASPIEEIRDHIRVDWQAMDSWFEEDEEVFTHPRDPHHRIDILRSSRHVEVFVKGVKVADSDRPTLLFETGLPTRYYLPLTDVRTDLLRPSSTSTGCPYKGTASYWSLVVGDDRLPDVVWTYLSPLPESTRIAGLASFYNEQVDIVVDGVLQERPDSPFARPAAAA